MTGLIENVGLGIHHLFGKMLTLLATKHLHPKCLQILGLNDDAQNMRPSFQTMAYFYFANFQGMSRGTVRGSLEFLCGVDAPHGLLSTYKFHALALQELF